MRAEVALGALLLLLLPGPGGPVRLGPAPAGAAAWEPAPAEAVAAGAVPPTTATGAPPPLRVAVSVPPQAWLVERIGAPHVEVTTMLAAGGSEHAVELRPRQLAALERAHVYFKVGHPAFLLESQRIVPLLRPRPDVLIVDMLPGLAVSPAPADLPADPPADNDAADEAPGHGHEHGHAHGGEDPHVWLAPSVMRAAARNLERSLQQVDPAHAGDYARNRDAVERELDGVDARIRALLGETMPAPSSNRRFLVYHPAWGYFAREYGLEQVAIEEEGKEPSPLRLIQLIERARALEVDTVFVQRGMSTRSAKVVARELGARVVELDPMALDWKAAMLHAAQQIGRSLRAAADRASGSPGVADSLGAQAPAAPPHAGGTR